MSTIITREGKGSELEWTELDANFTNLNADKVEITAVNDAVLVETTARIAADALLAPQATTYTKNEVDTALSGKASAANNTGVNTGDQTLAGLGGLAASDLGSLTVPIKVTDATSAGSTSLAGSALDIAQTWATTGNPTAIKLNVTNNNSGSTSKLMDLQVGGSSKFSVDKNGSLPAYQSFAGDTAILYPATSGGSVRFGFGTTLASYFFSPTSIRFPNCFINWSVDASISSTLDLALGRDAANTLAQRNGINPQSSRLYRTYSDASNYAYSDSKQDGTAGLIVNAVNVGSNILEPTNLVDYQLNGVSKFSISKSGAIFGAFPGGGPLINRASNIWSFCNTNSSFPQTDISTLGIITGATNFIGFNADTYTNTGSADLKLYRDAANTLAQRNTTNSQTFRLYNTYTTASDWERLSFGFAIYSGASYAKLAVEGGGTSAAVNIGIALSPKGTGAITAQVPDGTAAGGNARGANSVDLQTLRNLNTQVASGLGSVIVGGNGNSSTIDYATVLGGQYNTVSSYYSCTIGGYGNKVSGQFSTATGAYGLADKRNQIAVGLLQFTTAGDMQYSSLGFAGATTNDTITEIFLGNAANAKATIPNNTTWAAHIDIVARSSGGTENAYFKRRLVIKKDTTAASTALVGSVETVGDIGTTNMLAIATPITLTADTASGAMKLEVTGLAATTIRWVAKVSLVEVGYT